MISTVKRTLAALLAVPLILLPLAACGGGDDGDEVVTESTVTAIPGVESSTTFDRAAIETETTCPDGGSVRAWQSEDGTTTEVIRGDKVSKSRWEAENGEVSDGDLQVTPAEGATCTITAYDGRTGGEIETWHTDHFLDIDFPIPGADSVF